MLGLRWGRGGCREILDLCAQLHRFDHPIALALTTACIRLDQLVQRGDWQRSAKSYLLGSAEIDPKRTIVITKPSVARGY